MSGCRFYVKTLEKKSADISTEYIIDTQLKIYKDLVSVNPLVCGCCLTAPDIAQLCKEKNHFWCFSHLSRLCMTKMWHTHSVLCSATVSRLFLTFEPRNTYLSSHNNQRGGKTKTGSWWIPLQLCASSKCTEVQRSRRKSPTVPNLLSLVI